MFFSHLQKEDLELQNQKSTCDSSNKGGGSKLVDGVWHLLRLGHGLNHSWHQRLNVFVAHGTGSHCHSLDGGILHLQVMPKSQGRIAVQTTKA